MKRPILSRLLPDPLKQWLYYRYFHARHADFGDLFQVAPLALAPRMAMHGLLQGDVISGSIAFTGFFELALSRQIAGLASRQSTFVDVGANMGYFTLLWAGLNPSGRVVAFEASPRNVGLLRENISRNSLGDRVTVIPKAAGKEAGTITFDAGPADQTGWGGISLAASPTTFDVPLVRLDEELPDSQIDVLKVDVEGADTWVLFGCEKLLRNKRIGTIFFEENRSRMERFGIKQGEAQSFLRDLGYRCVLMAGDEGMWTAFPENKQG